MPNDMLLVTLPSDTIALLLAVRRDEEDGVATVINRLAQSHFAPVPDEREADPGHESEPISQQPRGKYRYEFLGEEGAADTLGKLLSGVLRRFADLDAEFLEKFSEGQGRTRRFLTRDPKGIYPGREDLSNYTAEVYRGWWVGTNYSRTDVRRLLRAACQVAGLIWEVDLRVEI